MNYDLAWNKINETLKAGKPKTALELIEQLYAQAAKENNAPQQIKALIYKGTAIGQVEEDSQLKNIAMLEAEINRSKAPVKQVLYSLTAGLYHQFYENNRWNILDRSATNNADPKQPATWAAADFEAKINALYQTSLTEAALLQSIRVESYDPIVFKGNARHLRPTLYDLLAHQALDYWKNEETDITQPAYAFSLSDAASLAPAALFVRHKYVSKDSSSHSLLAIQLYQQLIAFHQRANHTDALLDVDIARLEYAAKQSTHPGKKQLYKEALEQLYTQNKTNEQAMRAGYLLATWWHDKAENYVPATGHAQDRMAYATALQYCREVMQLFPKSEGGIRAANLAANLQKASLSLAVENVNESNQPMRALLTFRNTATAWMRLVKLPENFTEEKEKDWESDEAYWKRLAALPVLRSWQQPLPAANDYRSRSAEIKIDALPNGRYLLLTSSHASFVPKKNALAAAELYVSNISFVHTGPHYFVLHRRTGQPLTQARVQVWHSYYDYNRRKMVHEKGKLLTTNEKGYVLIENDATRNNRSMGDVKLEISTPGKDYLFLNQSVPRSYNGAQVPPPTVEEYTRRNARYFIFTDRSLYRPGQTLFFKAIGLTKNATNGQPLLYQPGQVEVTLRNANYEVVSTQQLSPSEYASIHGSMALPMGGLTGSFQLELKVADRTWTQQIRVEEYKRPKFEVTIDPLQGSYRVNNVVKVSGMAKGLAGNAIDGARVQYRVYRNTRFLYPWRFGGRGWPPVGTGNRMEIAHGSTNTQANGSFELSFTALPDLSIDRATDPSFDYTIEATVTDLNGESRDAQSRVTIGYTQLLLSITKPVGTLQPVQKELRYSLQSTNLNGVAEPATVEVAVYALQAPGRRLRKRLWDAPDTTVMREAEFVGHFPRDPYGTEDDPTTWQAGAKMYSTTLATATQKEWVLAAGKMPAGHYRIEATTQDKDGQPVKAVEYLQLFDPARPQAGGPEDMLTYLQESSLQPGQAAELYLGAPANAHVIELVTRKKLNPLAADGSPDQQAWQYLQQPNGWQKRSHSTTEADYGGYQVQYVGVYNNRVYVYATTLRVPWSHKDLHISMETFRNKLEPGQQETWKVKISGAGKEVVAAELLAGMYDASLDQLFAHAWQPVNPWENNNFYNYWQSASNFTTEDGRQNEIYIDENYFFIRQYDRLMGMETVHTRQLLRGSVSGITLSEVPPPHPQYRQRSDAPTAIRIRGVASMAMEDGTMENAKFTPPIVVSDNEIEVPQPKGNTPAPEVTIRKNFNETAFFLPALHTDAEGNISFSFTMPEALTAWKLQLLAHTKDARFAYATQSVVTQKELMVLPNAPRFLRQGDNMEFTVKISNLSAREMTGQATLTLLNAATLQPVDGWFKNVFPAQYFTAEAGQSTVVRFPMEVPYLYNEAVLYRVEARSGSTGDGEEMVLPVLTNRILVTESFPLNVRSKNEQSFTWKRFLDKVNATAENETMDHHSLTVEYTTNPAWYAVQALPYLMEYPYDCAEQTWNRLYANALAGKIANSSPRIRQIFEQWKNSSPEALLSNLQKNQELKSALLEETPWVLDAKNEAQQKQQIALLFDLIKMEREAGKALEKLQELQSPNGGFVWFKGGPDDRYMTQYILAGMAHLQQLDAWPPMLQKQLQQMVAKAIPYLDARIAEDHAAILRQKEANRPKQIEHYAAQYLYVRSFFTEPKASDAATKAREYFTQLATSNWVSNSKYEQAMIAIALHRMGSSKVPTDILASLTENSIQHPEMGMYWKEYNNPGRYWWQAPIESHAMLMEAYHTIEHNEARLDDLKTWLLKQKQTTNWKSTRATAEACYALLMRGTSWLSEEKTVSISLGNYTVQPAASEAGTGYFKHSIAKEKISADMGKITISTRGKLPGEQTTLSSQSSWGAVYWQYFEDLDNITPAETQVAIKKELYVVKASDRGPVLQLLQEGTPLKVGDKVIVRVEIKTDRQLEYVHLKDMRASCFEPVAVLSGYRYQGGLGYYQSMRDASANYFIGYLPRGTWVVEYELRATHAGTFSNGITTLQSMYAPEFSSHSKGVRVEVE